MAVRVAVKAVRPEGRLPLYQTGLASGADVCAAIGEPISIAPGERALVPTGLAFSIPAGYEIQVRPRSGLAWKHGIALVNAPGTIDADYRGEVQVILLNTGKDPFVIAPGDRIAQLVLCPVVQADFAHVAELDDSVRGAGGFGSTGV